MVVFHISLLLSAAATASALAQCFTPNGTDRNAIAGAVTYLPCDATAEHSMCCGQANGNPDVCRPGGWCYNDYGNNWWRESCTDKTWQHPSCNKLFVNGTGYPGTGDIIMYQGQLVTDVKITPCENGSWCFGAGNIACCQAGKGVWMVNGTQTDKDPRASASATSSPSASPAKSSATSSAAASSSSGLSTGAKAGIGIGAALGALLIIGLLIFLWRRSRKNKIAHGHEKTSHQQSPSELSGAYAQQELPVNTTKYAQRYDPVEVEGSHPIVEQSPNHQLR